MCLKKIDFRAGALIYLIANVLFIVPIIIFNEFGDSFSSVFALYLVAVTLYFLFFLTYAHIIFDVVLLTYNIKKLKNDKKTALFAVSLAVIAIDIFVNIYWAAHGRPYTIQ